MCRASSRLLDVLFVERNARLLAGRGALLPMTPRLGQRTKVYPYCMPCSQQQHMTNAARATMLGYFSSLLLQLYFSSGPDMFNSKEGPLRAAAGQQKTSLAVRSGRRSWTVTHISNLTAFLVKGNEAWCCPIIVDEASSDFGAAQDEHVSTVQ